MTFWINWSAASKFHIIIMKSHNKPPSTSQPVGPINAFQVMLQINEVCQFSSIEKKGEKASNSEIRRWFNNKAIELNFAQVAATDPWPPVIKSLVLFPKSAKKRTTLIYDESITLIQVPEFQNETQG